MPTDTSIDPPSAANCCSNFNLRRTGKMNRPSTNNQRRGAVLPLFALILPALMILCGFAINLAYLQLVTTEMKICTDAASHAGGRALSIHQSTDEAYAAIQANARLNEVGGKKISIRTSRERDIQFGFTIREDGLGRHAFHQVSKEDVDNETQRATSVRVTGQRQFPLVFQVMSGFTRVQVNRRSTATQVDRDIALVLDRSGSMLAYEDIDKWENTLDDLYNWGRINYNDWRRARNYYHQSYLRQEVSFNVAYEIMRYYNKGSYYDDFTSANLPNNYLWERGYYRWQYPQTRLRTDGESGFNDPYGSPEHPMAQYAFDVSLRRKAPRFSRWARLLEAVETFTDVLGETDQKELIALVTFSTNSNADLTLQTEGNSAVKYQELHNVVNQIMPYGATAIGKGLKEGFPLILEDSDGVYDPFATNPPDPRPFAAKTIAVLTDGQNNKWPDPVDATRDALESHPTVTVHTVTFSEGAEQQKMRDVAAVGGGRHYHANDGDELVEIFDEIANNLPTILTE